MFKSKDYDSILKELYQFKRFGIRPALGPSRKFMVALGNPQKKYPCIHVAGTNGKGSTTAMIASVLQSAGYATGAYHSPHISDFRERFLLNGQFFPKAQIKKSILRIARKHKKAGLGAMTFFEWSTGLAFSLFADAKADAAVIETGMGGNFDATNVVLPEVSVVTNVSLEHTAILGSTIEKIAFEKAGIIKNGIPVVCGVMDKKARTTIQTVAKKKGSKIFFLGKDFTVSKSGKFVSASGEEFTLRPSMQGDYQMKNAALAVQAVLCAGKFRATKQQIESGIKNAFLPGRFEIIKKGGREIILDVAHNPSAIVELAKLLKKRGGKYDFIFGALGDKDFKRMLKILAPLAGEFYCVTPDDDRAIPAETLCSAARAIGIKARVASPGKITLGKRTCVTGSFTVVEAFLEKNRIR